MVVSKEAELLYLRRIKLWINAAYTDDLLMESMSSDGILKQQLAFNFCDYHEPMLILKQELRPG